MAANDRMAQQQQAIIDQLRITEAAWRSSEAQLRALNADLELQILERSHIRSQTWRLSPELLGVADLGRLLHQHQSSLEAKLSDGREAEIAQSPFLELVHPDDRNNDGSGIPGPATERAGVQV